MGKYEPLTEFLREQRAERVAMTFKAIESVIGAKLPPRAVWYRSFWSNNASNNVLTKAWLDAGFESEQVDMEEGRLVFRRAACAPSSEHAPPPATRAGRHPLIGAMKGTVWIAPGTDLTEPAMPEWGEVVYGVKSWDDVK